MIGKTVYELRKKKGLTLSELAKRAKISKSYLSNMERDLNRNPSIDVVKKIAKVLDVELEEFLSPERSKVIENVIDQELIDLATELKETGIQIKDFQTLIEFIKWKNQKSPVDKN